MIATRSHVSASTDRSWVIRIIERPKSRRSFSSSSRICACIITSSAVVGSSPMISSGLQASARAIITRWRMPPENSCGYCLARFGLMPTYPNSSAMRAVDVRLGHSRVVQLDRLGDLVGDPDDGVERVHRALEHDRHGVPAHVPQAALGAAVDVHHAPGRVDVDRALGPVQVLGQQAEQRERGGRLAAAGLAGQSQRLAAAELEGDPVDQPDLPPLLVLVGDGQVADVEQHLGVDRAQRRSRSAG